MPVLRETDDVKLVGCREREAMFSKELIAWIEDGFQNAMTFLESLAEGYYAEKVKALLAECTEEERIVMKYYFSAMPYSDIADTDFALLKRYAEHTVFLRSQVAWCREIPEKTFLMDVAAYRINNEKIMDCRELFYTELMPRVKDMSMKEAVIEANYWCAEHATYHLADPRTASALTVYRSGYGRCGEESVFAVTVLRSIGIPARQVYTPLWAHCDDNHAWVEVWCDGEWYFLGACEPEEVLNKGWFTGPASRAMLLHAKYFTCLPLAEAEFTEGFVHYVNRTSAYAYTTTMELEVVDEAGMPVSGLTVIYELLNSSEYGEIATKQTDENGLVTIEFGKGDVQVHLTDGVRWMDCQLNSTAAHTRLVFQQQEADGSWKESLIQAPDFAVIHPGIVTAEQRENNRKRAAAAEQHRRARLVDFTDAQRAAKYPAVEKRLLESGANFEELMGFLERDDNPYRSRLLEELTVKDMYDVKAEVLEEHLQAAMAYEGTCPEPVFVKFVMSPRVEFEELSKYRSFIEAYFTEEQKESFREKPERIWDYIKAHITYEENRDFERLRVTPESALRMKLADPESQRVLFCAICRTLGIPARIDFLHREATYYKEGSYIAVGKQAEVPKNATLHLTFEPGEDWHYFRGWTLNFLKDGVFHPLGLFRTPIEENQLTLPLAAGVYRLLTNVRMPDGNQLVRENTFTLAEGETLSLYAEKHHPKQEDLLTDKSVETVYAETAEGKKELVMPENGLRQMVLWLEPGKEPTQHVLNELKDNKELCGQLAGQISILVQDEEAAKEAVFAEVMKQIPQLSWVTAADWQRSENIAQSFNLQAYQYPLVYVKDRADHVIYADCGYNVGSVDLMLKLIRES